MITGTIKANFPTRISFQVTSKIDSRTILGEQGAEQLLGMGDMLYMAGGGRTKRLHGPFVADAEVETVVNHLKAQGSPEYLESVTEESEEEPALATQTWVTQVTNCTIRRSILFCQIARHPRVTFNVGSLLAITVPLR